jgi:hypothetical protein
MTTINNLSSLSSLPKENIPKFKKNTDCVMIDKIHYIFNYNEFKEKIYDKYKSFLKPEFVKKFENTCEHIFKKVGLGIFVFVVNGKIHTYQVFANTSELKPGTNKITKKHVSNYKKKTQKNKFPILKDKKKWGFSNCMVNFKENWWEKFYTIVYFDMLKKCLENSTITTCFFINLNDFPVLYNKKCGQHISNEETCSNNQKESNIYIPVLSGATTKDYYDKCLVYADSWEIASQTIFYNENKCKNRYNEDDYKKINDEWDTKKNELVFRGKNNSCYPNDFIKNDRLKVLKALKNLYDDNEIPEKIKMNVGFTRFTNKSVFADNQLMCSNSNFIIKRLKEWSNIEEMSMIEQSNCKYILNIDGYVTAWRLSCELRYNSCILLLYSKYYSWFHDKLIHMKNVYKINVEDNLLEDELSKALHIFAKNDNIGKKIAKGAKKLYDEIMNVEYIRKYMISLFLQKEFDILIPFEK